MIHRLYVHNFRCLENFELSLKGLSSALIIGKNGTGKTTVANVLEIFQKIGRGTNRVGELVQAKDFTAGRTDVPIRFELEAWLDERLYKYVLALELPELFREPRVLEEELTVAGDPVFSRTVAQVKLSSRKNEPQFLVDWHFVALPLIQTQSGNDPLQVLKEWLARMILLAPVPSLMTGASSGATLEPNRNGSNFGEWFSGLLGRFPAAYTEIDHYLRSVLPDLLDIQNETVGKDSRSLVARFEQKQKQLKVDFADLSDGEKCFFAGALVLAANKHIRPLFCLWDEPENFLAASEVGPFVISLRRSFKNSGQFVAMSHDVESIRKFSSENTILFHRNSHLEPVVTKLLKDIEVRGDLRDALILDELRP
jgi:predicted ATPase